MKFGTGSNNELKQNDIRTSKHIYKQTNIPNFQLCYPCKCLAHYACSPINIIIIIVVVVIFIVVKMLRQIMSELMAP